MFRCKPFRMWIDGHCFNLLKFSQSCSSEQQLVDRNGSEFNKDIHLPIVRDENQKLSFSFQLPRFYYMALQDVDILDIPDLSKRTNTTILLPKLADGKMTIIGEAEESVLEALGEVHTAVGEIRYKTAPKQFLSVRCSSGEIQNNFERFKKEILAEKDIRGMDESIFQRSTKLHLTIDVLVLLEENERKVAVEALEEYNQSMMKPLVQKTGPLRILVSGIECMNSKHDDVNVLYAKAKLVDETETSLQNIANDLSHHFYERGLLKSYQENVKLHCTLINTKYRKRSNSPRREWKGKKSFDARRIMERYRDFEFGQCDFNQIHLSVMSSSDSDGYYKGLASINLI